METVKKVKFPIASIFFLFVGLNNLFGAFSFATSIISSFNEAISNVPSFLVFQLVCACVNILYSLTFFYLAVVLFTKKRNFLIPSGFISLLVISLINFITNLILHITGGIKYDSFPLSVSIHYSIESVIFSILYTIVLLFILILCIFLVKENSKAHKTFCKIWFLPGLMYLLLTISEQIYSTVLYYDLHESKTDILNHIITVTLAFLGSALPSIISYFLLLKWLAKPYKFVKVVPKQEQHRVAYAVPVQTTSVSPTHVNKETEPIAKPQLSEKPKVVQEEAFVRTSNYEGPVVYEGPEPTKATDPIVKPEPVQKKAVAHTPVNSNSSSVENIADDLYTLKKLYDDGVLTEEEFAEKKRQLLNL